jgi:hypothetical protein
MAGARQWQLADPSARLRSRPTASLVGRAWVELDLGYATVLDSLRLVRRGQADDVVEGQPHGVEPDLPVRMQRRELPASLDPHLDVGVPRHQPSSPEPPDLPRRSATGR